MSTTNVTAITASLTNQVKTQLLRNLRAKLVLAQFAQEGMVDKGHNVIRFLQVPDVAASATTLADDGVNPTPEALTMSTVDITPSEIGRLISVTRRTTNISPVSIVQKAANILSFDAARRIDTIIWTAGTASGTVRYSGSAASRVTTSANMVAADVRKWGTKLRAANALPWDGNTWVCVTHPFAIGDLQAETAATSWLDTNKYATPDQLKNGEIGKLFGTRFMDSTNSTIFAAGGAGSVDIYASLVFGQEAIGAGTIQNVTPTFVPATPDHADGLGRSALIGYYMDTGAAALQAAAYVRFESAVTAL